MQKRSKKLKEIYPINDRLVCFFEEDWDRVDHLELVSLVEFDFVDKIFRKLYTFELDSIFFGRIFVDDYNSSKFTLVSENHKGTQIRKFEFCGKNVSLGHTIQFTTRVLYPEQYFDGCLYRCSLRHDRVCLF
jgi:hypothetical protein